MTFDFTPTRNGLRIHDRIENSYFSLVLDHNTAPTETTTDQFRMPLDAAVEIEVSRVEFELLLDIIVWGETGCLYEELTFGNRQSFSQETYELELENSSFKCYARVHDSSFTIDVTGHTTAIVFDSATTLTLGVRSFHERPAGHVATTMNPQDLAMALSSFGSGLKTHSPERSYPTLRGHPPELSVGTRLSVPDELSIPDTGMVLEVPSDVASVLSVAPLSYYLGARIETGSEHTLHLPDTSYRFEPSRLATDVLSILHHCFVLDCIVRTEGLYEFSLRERRILESRWPFDAARLYELPIAERTSAYLEIPRDETAGLLPWPQVADVPPTVESLPLLPYLIYSLSAIRSPPSGRRFASASERDTSAATAGTRSFNQTADTVRSCVVPTEFPALHNAWLGVDIPLSGSKPVLSAALARRQVSEDDSLHVNIICNDSTMEAELLDAYGTGELGSLTVSSHLQLTVGELRALFAEPHSFLHFVGHVDAGGIRCTDGVLDTRTLPEHHVDAFLLNGCTSTTQGFELLDAGSSFGIVTTSDIENERAIEAGRTIARLLDRGFTPADTMTVLQKLGVVEYSVIGDGNHRLCPAEDASAYYSIRTDDVRDGAVKATYTALPNGDRAFGGVITTRFAPSTGFLQGTHDVILTRDQLGLLAETSHAPLIIDGDLRWFHEFDHSELWDEHQ